MNKKKGLYIHIPFCDTLCPYCAFAHVYSNKNLQEKYIERILEDLNLRKETFSSIYIGGGTPSVLSFFQFKKLLQGVSPFLEKGGSFTIEANPSSLDERKIAFMAQSFVNRISLGIQTFQAHLQEKIQRFSSFEKIQNLIETIRKYDIIDINVDLMYGIDGESLGDLERDLETFLKLKITHLSCYCLQIEKHTMFYNQKVPEMEEDAAALQYERICKVLKEKGFIHYEVSNFALPSYESQHNLLYWKNEEYAGIGISAAGYENHIRYQVENSLSSYLKGKAKTEEEILTIEVEEEYFILLALRLKDGIDMKEYQTRYHKNFFDEYKNVLPKLLKNHDLIFENDHLFIPEEKWFTMNRILLNFLKDSD